MLQFQIVRRSVGVQHPDPVLVPLVGVVTSLVPDYLLLLLAGSDAPVIEG
jgi:hypothetical protein